MNRKLVLQIIVLGFSLSALSFISTAGPIRTKATKPPLVNCSIRINSTFISPKQAAIVWVTIENGSRTELNVSAFYSFEMLMKSEQAVARRFSVLGDSYWSPLDSSTGKSLGLPADGRVPRVALHLRPGEAKSFDFELTNLLWNATMSSIWPHANLFDAVPKGNYWLVLKVWSRGEITSNKVEVVVE